MHIHFDSSAPARVAHVVVIPKKAFVEVMSAMPPTSRFTNVEQWRFNHVWFFDPTGDIIILTPEPIAKLESCQLEGCVA